MTRPISSVPIAPGVAELPELGRGAHFAAIEKGKDDRAHVAHAARVILDEAVGDPVRKPHAPARLVEAQEVVAELVLLRGPQLANGAARAPVLAHHVNLRFGPSVGHGGPPGRTGFGLRSIS